jgi:cytochrome oxidase Cu insertion factor (SCO1/SenC/PrrC family)
VRSQRGNAELWTGRSDPGGEAAPAFTLESAEGKRVSLSDHAGKPVLLNFSMGPG